MRRRRRVQRKGWSPGKLNDLTGEGYWAFNQAYLYAGVEAMGEALERDGNPRAAECLKIAQEYRKVHRARYERRQCSFAVSRTA